jgi:hypothetical protein
MLRYVRSADSGRMADHLQSLTDRLAAGKVIWMGSRVTLAKYR